MTFGLIKHLSGSYCLVGVYLKLETVLISHDLYVLTLTQW